MKLHTDLTVCLNEKLNSTKWEGKVLYSVSETAFLIYVCC